MGGEEGQREGAEGRGGEMTQTMYAYMNNNKKPHKVYSQTENKKMKKEGRLG
jgi:hypothetical protein